MPCSFHNLYNKLKIMGNQEQVPISLKPDMEMEAFYASLESPSTTTMKTNTSEQTQKAIQILKHLFTKSFSLLLHPGRSITLKETLNYLINLPPNEEFSPRTRSEMLLLLQCFTQWNVDYYNAGVKLNATTAELENAVKVVSELEGNVREFMEIDKVEKGCFSRNKSDYSRRDNVVKRKIELFKKGSELKALQEI